MTLPVHLEPAQPHHRDAMAALFRDVCRRGDALPFTEDTPDELFDAMWLAPGIQAYVALEGDVVVGMYKLNANFPGRASHVSSATFLVSPPMQGRGIGGAMLRDALAKATAQGFRSMQFNFVVSTNAPAVALYQKQGFTIAGTLPGAFHHATLGFVDACVMTRALT